MSLFLTQSSIGRKLVMSITGLFLILFLTFHMCMNLVAILSAEGYNAICEFLGANWYALVGTAVLAAGFIIHIIYAFWLTVQNRAARGADRYAVVDKPKDVEWASQNMLVLGIIMLAFLGLHLYHFWSKMQLVDLIEMAGGDVCSQALENTTNGFYHIVNTFSSPINTLLYIIALAALWFHLSHGFWSALQTIGFNNTTWFDRIKWIGRIWATIVVLGFIVTIVMFFLDGFFGLNILPLLGA
jgi:succinate dehydrogenase / fumarate reductase cytochrome b subunit